MKKINQQTPGPVLHAEFGKLSANGSVIAETFDLRHDSTSEEERANAALFAASYTLLDGTARALRVDATELAKGVDLVGLIRAAQTMPEKPSDWDASNPDAVQAYDEALDLWRATLAAQLAKLPKAP